MEYVPRLIGSRLRHYLETFPVAMVWGPRQCGKSTFVLNELNGYARYDLERPADFNLITSDPELFTVLRHVVDKQRRNGRFVLLGSPGPLLMRVVSETLAGRIGILELTPFTASELSGRVPWQQRWMWGGLPPLYDLQTDEQRVTWLESYLQTVLQRDLPLLGVRVPPARLSRLWSMLSHVHAQLLNTSALARSMELSTTAITHYLDVLEGAHLIRRRPAVVGGMTRRPRSLQPSASYSIAEPTCP